MEQPDSKCILFVDDDEDDRMLFESAVTHVDHTVRIVKAADVPTALGYLNDSTTPRPSVIFLDLNMPKKTGFECLEELKKDQHFKNIPVLIFTTSSRAADKENALSLGAIDFITKPNSYLELCNTINNAVTRYCR
jgi:CheY-like chemotaxis protein